VQSHLNKGSALLLDKEELKLSLDLAVRCLTSPPIYNNDPNSSAFGGFDGIHCLAKAKSTYERPFVYTEITGYSVLICLKLWRWERDQRFLELARRAGDWIIKAQYLESNKKAYGGFFDRYYKDAGEFYPYLYTYPGAVCCGALIRLYQTTKEPKYLESAKKNADWLTNVMWQPLSKDRGAFKEYYHLGKDSFSLRLHPYEAVCTAMTLFLVYGLLRDEKYQITAEKALSWALESQRNDGSFPMYYDLAREKYNPILYTHFIAYTLYNLVGFPLLDLSEMFDNVNYMKNAARCADWLRRNQAEDGGLFTYYYRSGKHSWHKQSPSVAQAVCAWLKLFEMTGKEEYREAAIKGTRWLIENQHKVTDENHLSGGFYWIYPNKRAGLMDKMRGATERLTRRLGLMHSHLQFLDKIPTWSTQFAIEALHNARKTLCET
jgi:uncharacterized protein YyaL (SSP411 family)